MTTEEQNLNVEQKEPVTVGASAGAGCCGCKPDGENEGAPLEAQAPGPAGKKSDSGEAATTGPCASPRSFAEWMKRRFAAGGSGVTSGPSAAMANCHHMLKQCMPGGAPPETEEPSSASVAAGWKTREV